MSFTDVTDVLLDPDIAGQIFTVVRRQDVVNDHGEGEQVTQVIPDVVGAIYPTGENSLIREVAAEAQAQTITVVTPYRLRPASQETSTGRAFQPDLVLWQGNYYVVWSINEYMQYGVGFVQAECMETDYTTEAPQSHPAQVGRLTLDLPAQSGLAAALFADPPKED